MEVTKDLQKNCAVTVTLNQTNADYTILLNRESKKNRGLLRSNSQVQVANKAGDVLGTSATHTVGNAAKDACQLILADWQEHGRMNAQESPAPAFDAPDGNAQARRDLLGDLARVDPLHFLASETWFSVYFGISTVRSFCATMVGPR